MRVPRVTRGAHCLFLLPFTKTTSIMRKLLEIKWFVLLGLLTLTCQVMAQTRTITGKVTDAAENPIANVSVVAKGTRSGTST